METREREMLKELLDLDSGLRPFEVDFIEDLSHRDQNKSLSMRQRQKLFQIHELRIVRRGKRDVEDED